MKIQSILIIIFLWISIATYAQYPLNQIITDTTKKQEILLGYCNREGLKSPIFFEHYNREYQNYTPKAEIIGQLGAKAKDYSIVVVMGSWCGDSQDQVPRMYKIFDAIGLNEDQITLICVNRNKQCIEGNDIVQSIVVEKVPTIVVYRHQKEVGRIIETPTISLEEDLLKILEN